ncbi:MAG TPA: alpha/beta fold hydrolase, partial [Streptosporangiaceae bacterium]|nr:alpha/beta fold hydrolase [Streptosporangiaceae bacterium]
MTAPPADKAEPVREAGEETMAAQAAEAAGALDLLLTDAALGVLRLFRPDAAMLRLAAALAGKPHVAGGTAALLAAELGKIISGGSTVAPNRRDRRFADPAWTSNPFLRRAVQAYLAAGQAAEGLLAAAGLGWRDGERMKFLLANLIAAAAPSNNPLISPVAWKAAIDSGGLSAVRGIRALVSDLASPPRVPAMVEPGAFEVGKDLAATPGAVVHRTEVFELIQYRPVTETVYRYPLVIVPPMVNKFYITDLAPGRSMIEYLVSQGHQVFVASWRNPDRRHRDWNLDTYGGAVLEALETACSITRAARASLCALCSGGIVSSMVAAHLNETGRMDRLASLCLGVTVLDQSRAGTASALLDEGAARAAKAASRARGYLDGRALAEIFAWLRPDDLIWNYWVNNYLRGKKPPPFDILYWNADTTRLPAALHAGFIDLGLANALTQPGKATMLGSAVDLSKVDVNGYVVAGVADHLCPWQSCYRSTQLLGGTSRFVLSTSGHIAALVNPPGNPKASFYTGKQNPADADE